MCKLMKYFYAILFPIQATIKKKKIVIIVNICVYFNLVISFMNLFYMFMFIYIYICVCLFYVDVMVCACACVCSLFMFA